ncbi:hypothetical protein ACIQAL_21740 [Pseudomonas sp. NPDC088368]|uniref:hypothetical protein n=1 Tax=Pseudomonas sp. NPDC088368 TaxID=3364453 RepID=UPI0038273200
MPATENARTDLREPSEEFEAKFQSTFTHFHADAKALKRGMRTALFVQRFKRGLTIPIPVGQG